MGSTVHTSPLLCGVSLESALDHCWASVPGCCLRGLLGDVLEGNHLLSGCMGLQVHGQTCHEQRVEASLNWTAGLLAQDTLQPSPSTGRIACERGDEVSALTPELWELPERTK